MSERTAVLFLVLCIAALLGLIELEKVFEEEKIAKKERQIAEIKQQKEDQKKAAELEDKIFKVRIKHDGRPETSTATVILDAGGSYDPNKVDKLIFEWKQISGKTVYLEPNPSSPRARLMRDLVNINLKLHSLMDMGRLLKTQKLSTF